MKKNKINLKNPKIYEVLRYGSEFKNDNDIVLSTRDLDEAMNYAYQQRQSGDKSWYMVRKYVGYRGPFFGDVYDTICTFGFVHTITENDPHLVNALKRYELDIDIAKRTRDDYIKKYEDEVREKERLNNKYRDCTIELGELKSNIKLVLILDKYVDKMSHEEYIEYQNVKEKLFKGVKAR